MATRPPALPVRAFRALERKIRLALARLAHPAARLGAGCDIRRGLHLSISPGARVAVGEGCILDRDLTIECTGTLRIGRRTIFGHHCTLAAHESVEIGEDCLIAEMVSIRDHDHCFDDPDLPIRVQGENRRPVRIGDNVWLGAKVTVVKGVTIGDNAIVGANSVVTRDIPANAMAVGSPARVIRTRPTPTCLQTPAPASTKPERDPFVSALAS